MDTVEDLYKRGVQAMKSDQWEDAIQIFVHITQIRTNFPEPWLNLGLCYRQLNDYPNALHAYLQAVKYRPKYYNAWLNMTELLLKMNRPNDALASIQKALLLDKKRADGWNNYACVMQKLGHLDEAETSARQSIQMDASNLNVWDTLHGILIDQKKIQEAQQIEQQYLSGNRPTQMPPRVPSTQTMRSNRPLQNTAMPTPSTMPTSMPTTMPTTMPTNMPTAMPSIPSMTGSVQIATHYIKLWTDFHNRPHNQILYSSIEDIQEAVAQNQPLILYGRLLGFERCLIIFFWALGIFVTAFITSITGFDFYYSFIILLCTGGFVSILSVKTRYRLIADSYGFCYRNISYSLHYSSWKEVFSIHLQKSVYVGSFSGEEYFVICHMNDGREVKFNTRLFSSPEFAKNKKSELIAKWCEIYRQTNN